MSNNVGTVSRNAPFVLCSKVYRTNRGFKCGDKFCAKKFTVKVGTIYENSKIGLRTWFAAIYLCTSSKKGISSLQLSRQLGITQKSAWFVLHRVREMLKDKAPGMLNNMVEVDETYIGGKIANRHKKVRASYGKEAHHKNFKKTAVVALLERNNKVRTYVWEEKNITLKDMVRQHVDFAAVVVTDGLLAYRGLNEQYKSHEVVKHNEDETCAVSGIRILWKAFSPS